jgi:lipid-binding SYLF domain-containing protein
MRDAREAMMLNHPTKKLLMVGVGLFVLTPVWADQQNRDDQLLSNAGSSFHDLLRVPEAPLPDKLLKDCRCIAVFPGVVKGALGWGARRGHGVISCRSESGQWSAPVFMTITGGSFGLQLGVEKSDLVLFLMNERSARALVKNEFTLGARGGVAAGPFGRGAEGSTDIKLDAEIYSYARSKGLFAGLSIEGARVNTDKSANQRFYGREVPAADVLFERKAETPASARGFLSALPAAP